MESFWERSVKGTNRDITDEIDLSNLMRIEHVYKVARIWKSTSVGRKKKRTLFWHQNYKA